MQASQPQSDDPDQDRPDEASLDPVTWETLVDTVVNGECTPFLGAGVAVPHLPTGRTLAADLAKEYDYPLDDVTNLARVTQYVASLHNQPFVKRRVCQRLLAAQQAADAGTTVVPDNFLRLARLGLPIYVTTNYDDYMQRALASLRGKEPLVELCRWNARLADDLPTYAKAEPTPESPTVFHMHGHVSVPNSVLITEDDYIDFTVSLARRTEDDPVIPHFVRRALGNTSLLFVGYSLEDWNFRVLMRHLMKQQELAYHEQYPSLSIQLSDRGVPLERRRRAEKFLEVYLKTSRIDVHWGTAGPFLGELERRVRQERGGGSGT